MRLGWKVLVPGSLLWILAIFAIRTWRSSGGQVIPLLIGLGITLAVVLLVAFLVPDRKVEGPAPVEPASDYPVPPLDLIVPTAPRHKRRPRRVETTAAARTPALSGKETE
jgi:NADH-quinone oxidoreductase subunit H